MLPCQSCGYKRDFDYTWGSLVGKTELGCNFMWWKAAQDIKLNIPNVTLAEFPIVFDPSDGPNECPAFAQEPNPEMIVRVMPAVELAKWREPAKLYFLKSD